LYDDCTGANVYVRVDSVLTFTLFATKLVNDYGCMISVHRVQCIAAQFDKA